jgi:VCBS repeat-containing protein
MVMFNDAGTGKTIGSGTVAVKIESPDEKESKPVRLMGMQGHFGADVTLDQPGIWHFRVATKLADGKVRQFHSHHVVK